MTQPQIETKRLEGRVAQILNERELVINIGADKGVRLGMKFAVLAESPTKIVDPETHETLDVIDREKVRVQASEVRPRIAVCRTYRTSTSPAGPLYSTFTLASVSRALLQMDASPPKTIPETLRAQDAKHLPPLSPEESFVKINDRVIQVFDESK